MRDDAVIVVESDNDVDFDHAVDAIAGHATNFNFANRQRDMLEL